METHQVGESVQIIATITDTDEVAAAPTSVVISIKKPDGILVVDEVAMSSDVAGTYFYDYVADSERVYKVSIKATGTEGRVTIQPDRFVVEAAI